ncbi:MAG TPA: tRNA-dihydrouridine synthase family protein [Candidatus Paceibacterota bacterium]|nr:tRNA-dihydrouridine synthase family protein [Candidatus Paceibacterota bacterium]
MPTIHGFWDTLPKPFFVLAPMADVTDMSFRTVVTSCGRPDVFYTEFVSAHGLQSPGRERLLKDLAIAPTDHPIVVQFFGTEAEHLQAAGILARERGFDGVDINLGCPDRGVMKQGAGIAMAKTPEKVPELVAALRDGFRGPVAVKTRLGLYTTEEMETWIPAIIAAKPDVLVVHGRTMKEASKVSAHWDLIGRCAAMAHDAGVLCIGNGDVMSRVQGEKLATRWGVDGLMVGRGIYQNPWIFGPDAEREHQPQERLALLLRHAQLWQKQWEGMKPFDLMKKFAKAYISGWPGAAGLRARFMACRNIGELRAIIEQAEKETPAD